MKFQTDDEFSYKDHSYDDIRIMRICDVLRDRNLHKKDMEFVEAIETRLENHEYISAKQKDYLINLLHIESRLDRAFNKLEETEQIDTRERENEARKRQERIDADKFWSENQTKMPDAVREKLKKIGIGF